MLRAWSLPLLLELYKVYKNNKRLRILECLERHTSINFSPAILSAFSLDLPFNLLILLLIPIKPGLDLLSSSSEPYPLRESLS
jgi:hypothetical protein